MGWWIFTTSQTGRNIAPRTVTVSGNGDAFVQPTPFIAMTMWFVQPEENYEDIIGVFTATFMINRMKWRYSYGRQCHKTKFAKTEIFLPVTESGEIDFSYMETWLRVQVLVG